MILQNLVLWCGGMHINASSRFKKGWMIAIQKKYKKKNEYFDEKVSRIGELVN